MAERNLGLEALDALVGEWVLGDPSAPVGRTSFSWLLRLEDGAWRLWRDGPDFWQRFTGTFSEDGTTISGAWEISPDGSSWQHDLDLVYTRVRD